MRKKFLIKPRLQFRHLLWNLSVIIVCCFAGYFLFETMLRTSSPIKVLSLEEWLAIRTLLRAGFLVILMLLSIAVGIENYLLFHSIVGPIYALEKGLKKMTDGDWGEEVRIRDTDQLKELILAFEEMRKIVRERLLAQEKTSQILADELEKVLSNVTVENISDIRAKLKQIREQAEKKAA